jgi:predicted transposase YbfD/YdcC
MFCRLSPPRRTHQLRRWPGPKAVGKVERVRESAAKTSTEMAYYLLSAPLSPERLNEIVRSHWGVENQPHWRLDVVMKEDQDRACWTAAINHSRCGEPD